MHEKSLIYCLLNIRTGFSLRAYILMEMNWK